MLCRCVHAGGHEVSLKRAGSRATQGEGSAEERLEGLALMVRGTLRRPDMLRTIFSMRLGFSSSEEPAPLHLRPTSECMRMQILSWPSLTSSCVQKRLGRKILRAFQPSCMLFQNFCLLIISLLKSTEMTGILVNDHGRSRQSGLGSSAAAFLRKGLMVQQSCASAIARKTSMMHEWEQ